MLPLRPRPGGSRLKRALLLSVLLVAGTVGVWGCRSLGHVLHKEDPLERADVIVVLGGSHLDRPAEAGHLFLEGWAPAILLSRPSSDNAAVALRARGLTIASVVDLQRDALMQMGVPAEAIDLLSVEHDSTAGESEVLLALFRERKWSRTIVVTQRMHTARAGLAFRRRFDGTGARIIVRATRYDRADLDRWWANRRDLRFALFEAQKLFSYWIGAAD